MSPRAGGRPSVGMHQRPVRGDNRHGMARCGQKLGEFDRDRIQATYRCGVLEIRLPARESLGPESFRIDIG